MLVSFHIEAWGRNGFLPLESWDSQRLLNHPFLKMCKKISHFLCFSFVALRFQLYYMWNPFEMFCSVCLFVFPFREVRLSIKKCKRVCAAPCFKSSSELAYLEGALEGHSYSSRKSWWALCLRQWGLSALELLRNTVSCPLSLGDLLQCGTPQKGF